MQNSTVLVKRIKTILSVLIKPELTILWVGLLTYGIFIPILGVYWDDIALTWFKDVYGNAGLAKYFSTERPFWGLFYQLNMSLLGHEPWKWQVFGLFWRLMASYGLYFLIRQLWKENREPALIAGLVYLLYPGFEQQFIANTYGHFFLVFSAYFFSVGLSLYALKHKEKRKWAIPIAVFLAAVNVFCMEYYFMLELMRPLFFWTKLRKQGEKLFSAFKQVLLHWLPYMLVFLAAGIWRALSLRNLTYLSELNQSPLMGSNAWRSILSLFQSMGRDIWLTVGEVWGQVFQVASVKELGLKPWLFYLGAMMAVVLLLWLAYSQLQRSATDTAKNAKRNAWTFLLLGLIALIPAGIPFWTTGLIPNFDFPSDRFTLPFVMGGSMILIAFLYLALRFKFRRILFALLIALSAGYQIWLGFTYNTAWVLNQRFVWQMVWRMPSIEPNTLLISDEMPVQFYTDNSLTAAINLIYNPAPQDERIAYLHYYPTIRSNLDLSQRSQPINHDLRIGEFQGNTDQSLTFYYKPPGCFRIIDPEIEADNKMLSDITRSASLLGTSSRILPSPQALPPAYLYGSEPEYTWCYYFEKADLARQLGDWQQVAALGEVGLTLESRANDPAELFPFIEAYTHLGNWQRALDLTADAYHTDPLIQPALCRLWLRIAENTSQAPTQSTALSTVNSLYNCRLP